MVNPSTPSKDASRRARDASTREMHNCVLALRDAQANWAQGDLRYLPDVFEHVLERLGRAIAVIYREYLGRETALDLYFWPGYNSILRRGADRRVTLPYPPNNGHGEQCGPEGQTLSIHAGVGYRFPTDQKYHRSEAALWFGRLLTQHRRAGAQFRIGGTHSWVAQSDLMVAGNRGPRPLTALAVAIGETPSEEHYEGDVCYVGLSESDFPAWGQQIGSTLEEKCTAGGKGRNCSKWPYASSDVDTPPSNEEIEFRRLLYSVWLDAVFGNAARAPRIPARLVELMRMGYPDLEPWIRLPPGHYDHSTHYRWWYTLRLESTFDVAGTEEPLGSAMVFSSREIPPPVLYLVSSLVNRMYLRLRLAEREAEVRRQQRNVFAHQFADPVLSVLGDPAMKREENRFAIWMLSTVIAHIWGSIDIESPDVPVYSELAAGHEYWIGITADTVLPKLLRLALHHAVSRAARHPSTTIDAVAHDYRRVMKWAAEKRTRTTYNLYNELEPLLGIAVPDREPPCFMLWKGFTVALYHVLWQAAYHAVVAGVCSDFAHPPYLEIEWDDRACYVRNKGLHKPDVLDAAGRMPGRHDRQFYSLLEDRLRNIEVVGPSCSGQSDMWTSIIKFLG
jgi:hypothetical protein